MTAILVRACDEKTAALTSTSGQNQSLDELSANNFLITDQLLMST